METIVHMIDPFYDETSKILILGTIPSPKSREVGFPYGHPQNRFWKALGAVFEEPVPITVPEKKALLQRHQIALWDVLKQCDINGASDSSIRNPVANDFTPIFETAQIKAVFTTGATATKLYQKLTGKESIYLPSTSPANCAVKFDALVEAYRQILQYTT